jgi:CBS domain-containing protein
MLAIAVARKGEGYRYLAAALLFVSVPELASRMSSFKTPLFLTFIGLLTVWEPWKEISPRVPSRRRALKWVIGIAGGILLFGVFWMGGIKPAWRAQVDSGEVSEDVVGRLGEFGALAVDVTENLTIQEAAENMAGRASSSTGYFADAIRRVPDQVPHEDGALTMRAVQHVTMPRVLFPEKPSLGMDSWLVREYAGRDVAGARLGTSIGFTYIGQFYVDYGFPVMLFPLFLYGILIGILYRLPIISSVSKEIYFSVVTVIFVDSFLTYGADLAKQSGSLIMKTAVITAVLYLVRSKIHKISKN